MRFGKDNLKNYMEKAHPEVSLSMSMNMSTGTNEQ